MKNSMILLRGSVHFKYAKSETGRELGSATELSSRYVFLVSQCIHLMFGKMYMKVAEDDL